MYGAKGIYVPLFFNSLPNKKVVTTIHEVMAINPATNFGKIAWTYGNFLIKNVIRNSSALIVHSKHIQKLLENFTTKKIHYVPIGTRTRKCVSVGNARKKLGIKQKNVLLAFGFLVPNKKFELLIKALGEMNNAFLIVAGEEKDKNYSESLKKLAEDIGVRDRVKFMGFVSDDKLPLIFGAADLVIFPYSYSETSGAIYTALGFGKCIIASKISAFDEFECIEKFEDEPDLIKKIKYYLGNPKKIKELKKRQQKFAREISWPHIAKKIREIYLASIRANPSI